MSLVKVVDSRVTTGSKWFKVGDTASVEWYIPGAKSCYLSIPDVGSYFGTATIEIRIYVSQNYTDYKTLYRGRSVGFGDLWDIKTSGACVIPIPVTGLPYLRVKTWENATATMSCDFSFQYGNVAQFPARQYMAGGHPHG